MSLKVAIQMSILPQAELPTVGIAARIYYKLPRHLEAYFNIIVDRENYGQFVGMNSGIRKEVMNAVKNSDRLVCGTIASFPAATPPSSDAIIEALSKTVAPTPTPSQVIVALIPRPAFQINYAPYMLRPPPPIQKPTRAPRNCALCQIPSCSGGRRRDNCVNMCGKREQQSCSGRYKITPCISI
ncbi:hypothetical protein MBANPS3_006842 [Mucor bainieri]